MAITTVGFLNFTSFKDNNLQANERLTFVNYNLTDTSGISNNDVYEAAFDSADDVAIATLGGGLSVGIANSSGNYDFTNYIEADENSISNDDGTSVAFDSKGDIGYTSSSGLDIGTKQDDGSFVFTLYDTTSDTAIGSDSGEGVAFDGNDNVAYASLGGGLSIGKVDGDSYTFTNYNATNNDQVSNDDGTGVAFDGANNVGYVSDGGGLSIGTASSNTYTFNNYNTNEDTSGITNNSGRGVAFSSDGDVGYVSNGGGLSIGKYDSSDSSYTFTNYNSTTTTNITSDSGEGISFAYDQKSIAYAADGGGVSIGDLDSEGKYVFSNYNTSNDGIASNTGQGVTLGTDGLIGYASASGLSIGTVNEPTIDIDANDFTYEPRSDDNNLNIALLPVAFSYPLRQLDNGDYIKIIISDGDGNQLNAIYLTDDGETPANVPDTPPSVTYSFHSDDNDQYVFSNITNDGAGFVEGVTYSISSSVIDTDGNSKSLGDDTEFTIPDDGSLPTASFDENDLIYAQTGEYSNLYNLNNFAIDFSYPLTGLTSGEYIYIAIANSSGKDLVLLYLIARNGEVPDIDNEPETRIVEFHSDNNSSYVFSNLTNSQQGFAAANTYSVNVFVASTTNTSEREIYQSSFTTPAIMIEPNTPPSNPNNNNGNGSNQGAIYGGVFGAIGGVAALSGITASGYLFYRRKIKKL